MPPLPPSPRIRRVVAVMGFAALLGSAGAQDADFKVQGEYAGDGWGMQVIAKGAGNFSAALLKGGLPGAGWDGKTRTEMTGKFTAGNQQVSLAGGGVAALVPAAGDTMDVDWGGNAPPVGLVKTLRQSPTLGAAPPQGAIILFDGTGVSMWLDNTATLTSDQLLKPQGSSASQGATTKARFGDFTLHLEFRVPFMATASGQRRGNSGVYMQGRQELQVLDSFGLTLDHGADTMAAKRECGAFFEYVAPKLNMCFPPLSWQTYDVVYTSARYDAAGKIQTQPTHATVKLNGVVIHDDILMTNPTLLGDAMGPQPGPLRFQAYGDDVVYRNIWLVDGSGSGVRPAAARSASASRPGSFAPDGRAVRAAHPAAGVRYRL